MNRLRLPFFEDDDGPSLWLDLRSGRAGAVPRLGLCLAAAAVCVGLMMLGFGAIEAGGGRVTDEHIAIGMFLSVGTWFLAVGWIWLGYRRFRMFIQTFLAVLTVGAICGATSAVLFALTQQADFLVVAVNLMGAGVSVMLISRAIYRSSGGRRIADPTGTVRVNCPDCGYSMVGLESCQCPECGAQRTIDALILAQEYGATKRERSGVLPPPPPPPDAIPIPD